LYKIKYIIAKVLSLQIHPTFS